MKKYRILLLSILLALSLSACGDSNGAPSDNSTPSDNTQNANGNILIAYFSSAGNIETDESASGNVGHGNTKTIAEMIQREIGGDLFFIETVDKYPSNYNDTIDVAMQEQRDNARPALAAKVENMDDYDVIFLGFPNWWGTLPQPVFTFLDEYDFSGKTVIPFCTHEGSGFGRSIGDLESALPDATLLEGFVVRGGSASRAGDDVAKWLSDLNLPE